MNALRIPLCCLLLLIATVPAMAQGTYTQIVVPGIQTGSIFAQGINLAGDVVGGYGVTDYSGFLLSNGVFTVLNYPGASDTFAYGINDQKQVVGWARLNTYPFATVGFLYDAQSQTFTEINFPGGSTVITEALAINNAGTIVGVAEKSGVGFNPNPVGFEMLNGKYQVVLPHGFLTSALYGINNLGTAVGYARNTGSAPALNFQYTPKKIQGVRISGTSPQVTGINSSASIVGFEKPTATTVNGFLYQSGTTQTLQFPGSTETWPYAINDAGVIVGIYRDPSGNGEYLSFTWTPSTDSSQP